MELMAFSLNLFNLSCDGGMVLVKLEKMIEKIWKENKLF